MPKIDESVTVVTGASSGIGRATALRIAEQGGTVVLVARQEKALKELAEECEALGGEALVAPADVTDPRQVERCARVAIEQYGHIDAWVNNAAVSLFGRFEEVPMEDFRRVIETNLFGYVHGARAVLPWFREQGRGTLINVSSVVARSGQPLNAAYVASKFAIDGFSESLRMELEDAPKIRVCTIHPSSIDTPVFQHAANFTGRKVKPLEPIYPAGDVAEAIVRCIEKPRRDVSVGLAGKGLSIARLIAPGTTAKKIAEVVPKQHLTGERSPASHGNLFKPLKSCNTVSGGWRHDEEQQSPAGAIAAAVAVVAGAGLAAWAISRSRARPAVPSGRFNREVDGTFGGWRRRMGVGR